MADPTSDTPANAPEDFRPRATIKLKPMTPPGADAAAGQGADSAASEESAVHISPPPSTSVPGVKQTIKLRAPSASPADAAGVKPAIKIVPKTAEAPTGIPTAKPVDAGSLRPEQTAEANPQPQSAPIRLKKPESSTPTAQMKAPDPAIRTIRLTKTAAPEETPPIQLNKSESSVPTAQMKKPEAAPTTIRLSKPGEPDPVIQLNKSESSIPTAQMKKPESASPTIRLKKPEAAPASPSTATIQLKKPENTSEPTVQAKKVGEAPVPPERKLTLKLKSQPAQQKELPKNIIPGLNIPSAPPPVQKEAEQPAETAPQQQPPVAAPVETQTPVPEAVPEDKKKKGKLPKVKKQPAPPSSADEPNWFFLTLSCLTLIAVCFIAYLLFAQYMNMYEGMQIPIPEFLMPK